MALFSLYQQPAPVVASLVLISLWTLVWKGLSLWHASRNNQRNWYIAMLILNTAGLLPIIYLIWFKPKQEIKGQPVKKEPAKKKPAKTK